MCLAVPGEIVSISGDSAVVDFGGAEREVRLDLLEEVDEGDYVLVHTGYAIQVLSPQEAERRLEAWNEIAEARSGASV